MQNVLSDRVVPDGSLRDGFRFRISNFTQKLSWIRILDVAGLSLAEEVAVVERVLSEAGDGSKTHVWGIRSEEAVAKIRAHYDGLGFYDPKKNRYAYDCRTVSVTFGCDLSALGYGPGVPPFGTYATKVVRTALNLEILKWLRPTDAPGTPGRKKKTPSEVLSELLWSGTFSPYRLGRMLHYDMEDRGLADGFSEWICLPVQTTTAARSHS